MSLRSTLFPYTTLFRSNGSMVPKNYNFKQWRNRYYYVCHQVGISRKDGITSHGLRHERLNEIFHAATRSEEHTSELQSHVNLVCRLLLEKNKNRERLVP